VTRNPGPGLASFLSSAAILLLLLLGTYRGVPLSTVNLGMLSLLDEAQSQGLVLCDYPDGFVTGLWEEQQQLYRRHGYDLLARRSDPMAAVYTGEANLPGRHRPGDSGEAYAKDLAGFFAGLASDCETSSIAQRLDRARTALSLSQGMTDSSPILRQVGEFYFREARWDEALPLFKELADHPAANRAETIRTLSFLGRTQFNLGRYEEASTTLRRAEEELRELDAPHSMAHSIYYYQGRLLERAGQPAEAIRRYELVLDLVPERTLVLVRLATLTTAAQDYAAAERYLEQLPPAVQARGSILCLRYQVKVGNGKQAEARELRGLLDDLEINCTAPLEDELD
jgi:tetratricopeptide (TPR) repeat protein